MIIAMEEIAKSLVSDNISNEDVASPSAEESPSDGKPYRMKPFGCTQCDVSFHRKDLLTRHEKTHLPYKLLQCYGCNSEFSRIDHVEKHFSRLHKDKIYNRQLVIRLPIPVESPNPTEPVVGPPINPPCPSPPDVRSSCVYEKSNKIRTTPSPPMVVKNKKLGLKKNNEIIDQDKENTRTRARRPPDNKISFHFCECGWQTKNKWELKRHRNTHTGPYDCQLCTYRAARTERLVTHVTKVHKKHQCSLCSFVSSTKSGLDSHLFNYVHISPDPRIALAEAKYLAEKAAKKEKQCREQGLSSMQADEIYNMNSASCKNNDNSPSSGMEKQKPPELPSSAKNVPPTHAPILEQRKPRTSNKRKQLMPRKVNYSSMHIDDGDED